MTMTYETQICGTEAKNKKHKVEGMLVYTHALLDYALRIETLSVKFKSYEAF